MARFGSDKWVNILKKLKNIVKNIAISSYAGRS